MKTADTNILLDGLAFPEAPRWKNSRLWFTDQHARRVMTVTPEGDVEYILEMNDLPGGLGWMPDGIPVVVAMTERKLFLIKNGLLEQHADLSKLAPAFCNDMVIDLQGRAYVGNFGYDLHGGAPQRQTHLIIVEQDGRARISEGGLIFPNGMIITPDKTTLIVAETFASRLTQFRITSDGNLIKTNIRIELGNITPDGICLDAEGGIWIASPATKQVVRLTKNGAIDSILETSGTPYACMLGGKNRRTMFIMSSETDVPDRACIMKSGRVEIVEVEVPGAGLP